MQNVNFTNCSNSNDCYRTMAKEKVAEFVKNDNLESVLTEIAELRETNPQLFKAIGEELGKNVNTEA